MISIHVYDPHYSENQNVSFQFPASTQETTLSNSSANNEDGLQTCDDVIVERALSLAFSFFAILYMCYLITALIVYGKKMKLKYAFWKGRLKFFFKNLKKTRNRGISVFYNIIESCIAARNTSSFLLNTNPLLSRT